MSFSGTAVGQREQELKTIKTFLVYSLLGSLALHIGLLVSGFGNLLFKVPEVAEEPLEVTLVETPSEPEPVQQLEQPKPEIPEKSQILTTTGSPSGGGGGGGSSFNSSSAVSQIQAKSPQNPVVATKPSSVVEKPSSKIEPIQPLPSQRTSAPQSPAKATEPQNILSQTSSTNSTTIQADSQAGIRNNQVNQGVSQPSQGTANGNNGGITSNSSGISGIGVGGGGVGSGNGIGNGTGNGIGNGTGNGTGNGIGNGSGGRSQVATAPTTPKLRTDSGNRDGRAACRECNSSYPEWARKRGVEGRVEVAVDTDAQGNVTNVRLLRSSGNERLDAEHLARARRWKLRQSTAGRQGVTIGTEYAIVGSQRYRQVQQAKKRRQVEARNAESSNTASNSRTEVTNRTRRSATLVNENTPTASTTENRRVRRKRDVTTESTSLSTNNSSSSPPTNKRRRRRENNSDSSVTNNTGSSSQPTRRRRRLEQPASSQQSPQQEQTSESSSN